MSAWLTADEVEVLTGNDNPTNGTLHPLRVTRNWRIVHPSAAQTENEMTKCEISKMCGSGWLLEIYKDGICIHESQHPSHAYAMDAAKRIAK